MKSCWILIIVFYVSSCVSFQNTKKEAMEYKVSKVSGSIVIDGDWNKEVWKGIKPLVINKHMGDEPAHRPKVLSKVAWDDKALYVIFKVEDRYVRAVAKENQGEVWKDSCVELFFTPDSKISGSYFNVEINCGGTMLFWWHPENKEAIPVSAKDCEKVEIAHSMPKIVDPEISGPTTWTIEYRLPFSVVEKYFPGTVKPVKGGSWKANLYKCADDSSQPHWLTWSHIDHPTPKFHVPQAFGTLNFE